ncbi:MAG TPA: CocE/NonD family hydrolase, partial [Edaphobacter sp.]
AMWPVCRAHLQAFTILKLVSGQPVPSLVNVAVREPVLAKEVSFTVDGRIIRARSYSSARHSNAPALIVLHGVHHLGMDEPRLMGFAEAMASCGLRVLTPELPGIKDYHVDNESVKVIGESARWFAAQTGGPVGVMGLSFSGGLALVAAANPEYRQSFKFVFAVGSQDAMEHVSEYYLTGREVRPDGTVELLPAHEYGPLVLEYEHLADYVPAGDIAAVQAVLREHLYEDKTAESLARAKLNSRQAAEATRLMDSTSAETRTRLAAANLKYAEEMRVLSPRGRLKEVTIPVFLLHGEADNIIPSAETLWMANELPGTSLRAMLISPVLSHLDMDRAQPGAIDQWRLLHFFAQVMQAAEREGA